MVLMEGRAGERLVDWGMGCKGSMGCMGICGCYERLLLS